jgi:hypothetical protein
MVVGSFALNLNSDTRRAKAARGVLGNGLHALLDHVEHTRELNVRTVPGFRTSRGTTLVASPAWIIVTEITRGRSAAVARDVV